MLSPRSKPVTVALKLPSSSTTFTVTVPTNVPLVVVVLTGAGIDVPGYGAFLINEVGPAPCVGRVIFYFVVVINYAFNFIAIFITAVSPDGVKVVAGIFRRINGEVTVSIRAESDLDASNQIIFRIAKFLGRIKGLDKTLIEIIGAADCPHQARGIHADAHRVVPTAGSKEM